jgi:hypothetical protein
MDALLASIDTPAPLPRRIAAWEAAGAAYLAARQGGADADRCTAIARDRTLRTLQVLRGAREIATLAIEAMRARDAAPARPVAPSAPVIVARRRAERLPRAAYREADVSRPSVDSCLIPVWDAVWRATWARKGPRTTPRLRPMRSTRG